MTVHFTAPARDWILPAPPMTPLQAIGRAAAIEYGIPASEIFGSSRLKHIVRPRQLAFWVAHRDTDASLPDIGRAFGGRDHTTILHGIRAVEARMTPDLALRAERISKTARTLAQWGDA